MLHTYHALTAGFATCYSNVLTTRPAAAFGTSITPGQNTFPAYATLSITATRPCYAMVVNINSGNSSGAARDMLVNIGTDPAGGTNWATKVPYLLGSCASPYNVIGGGHWYYFPIKIDGGSTFAAQASVNNATVGTVRVAVWLYADPVHPEMVKTGQSVEAIGVVTASSKGTDVTAGTTSDGTWTSLGASTQQNFFWQLGVGQNNGSMTAVYYHADIAADNHATTPNVLVRDNFIQSTSLEQLTKQGGIGGHEFTPIATGTTIYGRMQCSGTAGTGTSMIAYGVG